MNTANSVELSTAQQPNTKHQILSGRKIYQIWLITKKGEILVQKDSNNIYTIEANTVNDIIAKIESEWGIITFSNSLEHVNSNKAYKNGSSIIIETYFLEYDFTADEEEMIIEKAHGDFIDVRLFEELLGTNVLHYQYNKESLFPLFAILFDRFNIKI